LNYLVKVKVKYYNNKFIFILEYINQIFRLREDGKLKVDFNNLQVKLWKLYNEKDNEYESSYDNSYRDLVNFSSTKDIPIHRWFYYKEGFSPHLVNKLIDETTCKEKSLIFDPCSGSATTLLSAKQRGIISMGFEINPLSIFIGRTKLENYTRRDLKEIENFRITKHKPISRSNVFAKYELSIIEKLYDKQSLEEIETIKKSILKVHQKRTKNLLFLCLLSILETASNYRKGGNGLKRKSKSEVRAKSVLEIYEKKLLQIKSDLEINTMVHKQPSIIEDSCLNLAKYNIKGIDMSLFSPPYPNCFDPFERYKIELWIGEFIKSYDDLRTKRKLSIASTLSTNLTRDSDTSHHTQILAHILPYLRKKSPWNKRISRMLNSYFFDIYNLLRLMYSRTRKKGYCIIVIGNSAYGNIPIATDLIIGEIGEKIGFKVDQIAIARKNETSSQQYNNLGELTNYVRESLVIFKK
jgi:hypothetical protein